MVARSALVALVVLVLGARAQAGSAKLAEARDAIAAVRYNDAQPLLAAALEEGGNAPADVIEIYRLSASTATVLGQPAVAEELYRRWLALVPDATLPDTVAPKMREPFKAAQAYMVSRGHIVVDVRRKTVGGTDQLDVVIEADPLAMVGSVAIRGVGGTGVHLGADHAAHFDHVPSGSIASVDVLDEHDNRLVELTAKAVVLEPATTTVATQDESTPLHRSPVVWAIPALGFAAAGLGFGLAARRAQDDVADIQAHPTQHFIGDLDAARSRRDRDALLANIGFVAGGACAVTAAIMAVVRPKTRVTLAPATRTSGVVLVLSRRW